jgi:5-methylcytosine-specific restriction enzyme A
MPSRPPHLCAVPGCPQLATGRRCRAHAVVAEQARPNYAHRRWYRIARWRALRARVLREQAYRCALCGYVTLDLDIDHIVKHDGDLRRFWDRANLQALCRTCHQRKTQRGD